MVGFPGGSDGKKKSSCNAGWEDPLEKGMATHSSILAWNIPLTEGHKESGRTERLQTSLLYIDGRCYYQYLYYDYSLVQIFCFLIYKKTCL